MGNVAQPPLGRASGYELLDELKQFLKNNTLRMYTLSIARLMIDIITTQFGIVTMLGKYGSGTELWNKKQIHMYTELMYNRADITTDWRKEV